MLKRLRSWVARLITPAPTPAQAAAPKEAPRRKRVSETALAYAGAQKAPLTPFGATLPKAQTAFKLPSVPKGVISKEAQMAADSAPSDLFGWAVNDALSEGLFFPGYPYLSELTQRAEYRRPAEMLAQNMTRKWIRFQATGDDAEAKADKIKAIEAEFKRINAREVFKKALELDGFFGRAQVFIDCGNEDDDGELKVQLSQSADKITKGMLQRLQVVEPLWTYPDKYNTTNPLRDDFYRPQSWFIMGRQVHASRLLTIVSRPVPDMLKPAYIFGGLSLSQLAKPYVDNWLRTRQSVSDLLAAFNVFVLKTNMAATLSGEEDDNLFTRLDLFNRLRDNRGVFALDQDTEDFQNVSAPLSGLDHLQAQAQEHMSAVTGIPLVVLLGITPSGLNASSEGELRAFWDWIEAQQESHLRPPLTKVLNIVQLSLFGEVDPEITFTFVPLGDKSETDKAAVRKTNADTAAVLIDKGVIDAEEERERLAREEESLYAGLDLTKVIEPPAQPGMPGMPGEPGGEEDQADLAAMMAGQPGGAPGQPPAQPAPPAQPGTKPPLQ
ncbi:MAG TPA: DUF1073 domain-containing protein [Thermomonas sp.]|nr:DUF1073 domain-containing protein [Thermomonas sp.]